MTGLTGAVAAGWAAVAAWAASTLLRRAAARRRIDCLRVRSAGGAHHPPTPAPSPVERLGAAIRRLLPAAGRALGAPPQPASGAPPRDPVHAPPSAGRPDDPALDRRTGWAAVAGAGLLLVAPALAALPLVWVTAWPVVAQRRARLTREAQLHDQLPDVVDLLALTAEAGLPVGAALAAIGDRPGGPLGAAMALAAGRLARGASTADALGALRRAGPAARPLADALLQHDRYGTPLLPALERVAIEARAARRRRAEEAARRLPVVLLFPLILTTLPAFVLLTVVPLLAGSLGSLSLSPT
ncbi:MAG TPA: type II secretion system F family protein [Acidimicrobiales bacterium]